MEGVIWGQAICQADLFYGEGTYNLFSTHKWGKHLGAGSNAFAVSARFEEQWDGGTLG